MNVVKIALSDDSQGHCEAQHADTLTVGQEIVGTMEYIVEGNDLVLVVQPVTIPADGTIRTPSYDKTDIVAFLHRRIIRPVYIDLTFAGGQLVKAEPIA